MKKDFLLLHVPYFYESNGNDITFAVTEMPMGFYFIADQLTKAGIGTEIVNWTFEYGDGGISLPDYVAKEKFAIVGMSLHWHFQSFDVINAARAIKMKNPNVFIVLGGYTASAFAEEILRDFAFVDGVIRGEGEVPCVSLSKAVRGGSTLQDVPNLCWRDGQGRVRCNSFWVANEKELNSYDFANGVTCLKRPDVYPYAPIMVEYKGDKITVDDAPHFTMELGRGCPGSCAWCGGGLSVVKQFTGRNCVTLRSPEVVAAEIGKLYEQFPKALFYICYDPFPKKQEQIVRIIEILGQQYPNKIFLKFECFGLPTPELVQAYTKYLDSKSSIIISPDNALESIRNEMKSFSYTNEELLNSVRLMNESKVRCEVYFATLPNEEQSEGDKREELIKEIGLINPKITVRTQAIEGADPYSKWQQEPMKYGLFRRIDGFRDYLYYSEKGW